MNEIKPKEKAYLEDYDVYVNSYLTYAQIQQIANAVVSLSKPDENGEIHNSWAEREQCIDMLLLYHATDIGKEKLDELGHEICVTSGLVDAVYCKVENVLDIRDAIKYQESGKQALNQLLIQLPEKLKPLEEVVRKYDNKRNEQSRT